MKPHLPDSNPNLTRVPQGFFRRVLEISMFLIVAAVSMLASTAPVSDPESVFNHPPIEAYPRVMWMWMGCNLSKPQITRDLEAMKAAGFGGTVMFSVADTTTP